MWPSFSSARAEPGITRGLPLPERITPLPREYRTAELAKFFRAAYDSEKALFSTFLLTGLRELEVVHLFWTDVGFGLQTVRVTAKPELGFYPKRWEEREVPIPVQLIDLLKAHTRRPGCNFVFSSPKGNREYHMLDRCKEVAKRAGLDPAKFDLKTFRSTYASRTLRTGFDVRTVQHWMGHKSLETTMRYLVPSQEANARLDQVTVPGFDDTEASLSEASSEEPGRRGRGRSAAQREASGKRSPAARRSKGVTAKRTCQIVRSMRESCRHRRLAEASSPSTESSQAPVGQFGERLTCGAIRIDSQFENRDCLEIDYVVFRLHRGAIRAEVPLLPYGLL